MRKLLAAILGTVALVAAFGILTLGHTHANASALSPSARTCAAFATWNHSRTTAHLNAMITASLAAPWRNLGTDVGVVYFDVRSGNHTDLAGDTAGIASDCHQR